MFRLIDIMIDIIFFSINWKNYFDRSILVISMTVLLIISENPEAVQADRAKFKKTRSLGDRQFC